MSNQQKEEKLEGGNVSNVYRAGNTVRREMKPDSQKIHRLFEHLESRGYPHSPNFLGVDEKGREVLSFIEGEAGNYPLKDYMWSDDILIEIARMLRLYHDAVSDFQYGDDWTSIDNTPQPFEVLCHNDFAIYNIIFNKQKPVGIIDFDVAGPGPRLWDIAYTLYTCTPLSRIKYSADGEAIHYDPSMHAEMIKNRIHLFFKAYGINKDKGVIDMVILRLEGILKTIQRKACEGDPAFQRMIEEGHLEHYREDIAFIQKHGHDWV
ncbi:phosphotransferase [Rossellomorea aquimaris]|uniref:phosphotransferase n=1 Tax=Rossellomorea aquimaris TaxID=189382 RepID=UPI001CD3A29C|nr:phosphotransferase [Rossellomorea aquimaris]MCA1054007.1 phosphotransferase [Rossellomorea aquimaris]